MILKNETLNLIILLFCFGFSEYTFSQETLNQKTENKIKEIVEESVAANYSISDMPALDFISSDIEKISRPSTIKEFATSLFNGIDENGNVKQGLAFEFRVAELLESEITLEEYQKGGLKYMLHNLQLSLGTIAVSGDSMSTDLGWGVRITLVDKSDLMANPKFREEVARLFLKNCAPDNPDTSDEESELKCLAESLTSIKQKFKKELEGNNWNAPWLVLAYAGGIRLNGSEINQGNIIGHQISLAGGLRLGNSGQIGYMAQWSSRLKEGADMYFNELNLGTRLTLKIGKPTINFFSEFSYNPLLNKDNFSEIPEVDIDKSFSWSSGFEFLVSKNLWITTGLGQKTERIVGNNNVQLLSGLKLGFSDKQRIKF